MKLPAPLFILFVLSSSLFAKDLSFKENKGQFPSLDTALYYAHGNGFWVTFHPGKLKLQYESSEGKPNGGTVDIDLSSNFSRPLPSGILPFSFSENFYLAGRPAVTGVRSFARIRYIDIIPGMDLEFRLTETGMISSDYVSNARTGITSPPAPSSSITWSTYLGGSGSDEVWGIDLDNAGNTVVCGYTQSVDFPVSVGAMQDTSRGLYDAFISKFDQDGNLLWSTYYGSSANDFAYKVLFGVNNSIYVAGDTPGTDLPMSGNSFQPGNAGSYDAFLIKLDPSGQSIWSTYFGGSGGDLGLAITLTATDDIYFGGSTTSMNLPFSNGAFQISNAGPLDCYIAKFDSSGSRLWCTYLGGSGSDDIHSLSSDYQGNVIALGGSYSSDFPFSSGCYQGGNAGVKDAFLAKFDLNGNRIFATYIGGSAFEDAYGICTTGLGDIFIAGTTASLDFPTTPGCYQPNPAGGDEAFLMRFTPTGNLVWSTLFGGSSAENIYGLKSDGNTNLFLVGSTTSTDLPVTGPAPYSNNQGNMDAMLLKFTVWGIPVLTSYYGGALSDAPHDIAANSQSRVVFGGVTSSSDYPVSTGCFQNNYVSNDDGCISSLDASYGSTVGQQITAGDNSIYVFPNPVSKGEFKVNTPEGTWEISVYDQSGKKVLEDRFQGTSYSPALDTAEGLYTVLIAGKDRKQAIKVFLKK